MLSRTGFLCKSSVRCLQSMKSLNRALPWKPIVIPFYHRFSTSSFYVHEYPVMNKGNSFCEDVIGLTEDSQIIQLSQYVTDNNLEASLKEYSKIPLFLPKSDFRIVCSLMQQLGERCQIPDLDNIFTKIQKMKLSRRHALTFRCLIRLACELKNPDLIQSFYSSVCREEVYVNNSFLNDITIDCLFSLEAYSTICSIFESMQVGFFIIASILVHSRSRFDPSYFQQSL